MGPQEEEMWSGPDDADWGRSGLVAPTADRPMAVVDRRLALRSVDGVAARSPVTAAANTRQAYA